MTADRLPGVVIIGAMKTGTGSLHEYLDSHPQVAMSRRKELHFFVAERNWDRGLDWYREQFDPEPGTTVVGESSTSYAMFPVFRGVPRRMASVIPDARIVYVVRDPIERMRSHYLENRHFDLARREQVWGRWERDPIRPESLPVREALLTNPVYLSTSRYALQIERYLEHFHPSQLLVVTTEQLRSAREETVRRVYRFIGVDDSWVPPVLGDEWNRTSGKRVPRRLATTAAGLPGYRTVGALLPEPVRARLKHNLTTKEIDLREAVIPDDLREELAGRLRDDVRRLSELCGGDFEDWGLR